MVRTWCVLYILTWKCASRHNGVHFFDIATSKSGPRMVCFVHFHLEMCFAPQRRAIFHLSSGQLAPQPTFRPSGAKNHWKNTVFRDFPTFSRICNLLSSYSFSSNLSLLYASSLLCFSSLHIVGSLTSKLPSIIMYNPQMVGDWDDLLLALPWFTTWLSFCAGACSFERGAAALEGWRSGCGATLRGAFRRRGMPWGVSSTVMGHGHHYPLVN